jgi:hypothetical protein
MIIALWKYATVEARQRVSHPTKLFSVSATSAAERPTQTEHAHTLVHTCNTMTLLDRQPTPSLLIPSLTLCQNRLRLAANSTARGQARDGYPDPQK